MPLISALGRAPIRSPVLYPASPHSALDAAICRNRCSSNGTLAIMARSSARSSTTSS
jgi:hypothetical protein